MERSQFLRMASSSMRRILIDHARQHRAEKRGGGVTPVTLEDGIELLTSYPSDLESLTLPV